MTDAEKKEKRLTSLSIDGWDSGNEDEDGRSYWLEFLSNVMGMENSHRACVNFEKESNCKMGLKRIDVYIPETHVIIEQQKKLGKSLDQKNT